MMWVTVFSVIALSVGQSLSADPQFRPGYVYSGDLQAFYKLVVQAANHTTANLRCQREGASLLAPVGQKETDFVVQLLRRSNSGVTAILTGLSDPAGLSGASDGKCIVLNISGKLIAGSCSPELQYVCKKTAASVQWNEKCKIPDPAYQYDSTTGHCYKFHLYGMTWVDAFAVCAAEESYLAVINSDAEAAVIAHVTNAAPKNEAVNVNLIGALHLGFHNRTRSGFKTIFGETLQKAGYALWAPGQPDSANGPEQCGSMFYDLDKNTTKVLLQDIGCTAWNMFFICENDVGGRHQRFDPELIKTLEGLP